MKGEKAFQEVLQAHIVLIRKLCRAYSNGYDFEDLVQEVCLQIWRSLDKFRGESSQSTWIYRITLNVCINQLKKRENPKKLHAERAFSEEMKLERDAATKNDQLDQLYSNIKKLKPIERAIIMLYLDMKSHQQIADVVGMSTINVSVRINRIKKKLKKIIDHGNA